MNPLLFRAILFFSLVLSSATSNSQNASSSVSSQNPAPASFSVRHDCNLRVPMRDGIHLSADVYRPNTEGKFPVVLTRTPYIKSNQGWDNKRIEKYVLRGYAVVKMDMRGRGDSEGEFVPWRNEGPDGYDSVEWCASQPWSNGKIGMLGGSYEGRDQWTTAIRKPPHLMTIIPEVCGPDPFINGVMGDPTGVSSPFLFTWLYTVSGHTMQGHSFLDWNKITPTKPIYTMDATAGANIPFWRDMLDHPPGDPWWEPVKYQNQLEKVRIPVFHTTGWYDDERTGTTINFKKMMDMNHAKTNSPYQKLLIGPWVHNINQSTKIGPVEFGKTAVIDLDSLQLRWYDKWLKGIDNGIDREPPVRLFAMGANRWIDAASYPLPQTKYVNYFLHSGGKANTLSGDGSLSTVSPMEEPQDAYLDDPENPVVFPDDDLADLSKSVEKRSDVLVYTTTPLEQDVFVCGPVRARLSAASTTVDSDYIVRLADVWPTGYVQKICEGVVCARFRNGMEKPELIVPGKQYAYDIDLWSAGQVFLKGHKIRVEVASSAFDTFFPNPNTGEPIGKGTKSVKATQRIFHNKKRESYVQLPIAPLN